MADVREVLVSLGCGCRCGHPVIKSNSAAQWRVDVSAARAATDDWYMSTGQDAYRAARRKAIDEVRLVLRATDDLSRIEPAILREIPSVLATLRMSTAPPVARERLAALSRTGRPLMMSLEQDRLPARVSATELDAQLTRVCRVLEKLLDHDLFPWLDQHRPAEEAEREVAALVVADRRCESIGEPILRQAERQRQAQALTSWLAEHGYTEHIGPLADLPPGSYCTRPVMVDGVTTLREGPADAIVRPAGSRPSRPVMIKAVPRSATGTGSAHLETLRLGPVGDVRVLLLIGVADDAFLRRASSAGLEWVWEHRLDDLVRVGL